MNVVIDCEGVIVVDEDDEGDDDEDGDDGRGDVFKCSGQ